MTPEGLVPSLRNNPTAPVYVVGAGVTGCVLAERVASLFDRKVVVLEAREKVGGNSRAEIDPETGIEVHVYGSHIFHTTDEAVWNYVRRFTDFNAYRHRVFLRSAGRVYTMPIDLKTVNDDRNQRLFARYLAEAEQLPNLLVAGRLGRYRYWDMDGAVAAALSVFETS